jgi:hypothetical protein
MRWRSAAAALVCAGVCAITPPVAASMKPAWANLQLRLDSAPVEPVYWGWRGGVRIWIGAPLPPGYYGRPSYYGRSPYWYGGRGYWHRGWYRGGWRYW